MNYSRAYQFQLQAAEAAAAVAVSVVPVVHAAEDGEPEVCCTQKAPPPLKIQAVQGTAADEPAPRQDSGLAPTTTMVTIGNAEATATKCPECPKWFASEKAMFGHLRKHPERGYKGATRPTTATASAAATAAAVAGDKKPTKKVPRKETVRVPAIYMETAAAAKTEETELSTKWPASAKRGRTPMVPMESSSCCSEEEAAMILLELASSSRTSSEAQQQESLEPVCAPDAAAVTGHQIQTSVVEEPMLLDHPAGHQIPDPEAEQQILQPQNALELSAESHTPAVQQVTDLVITTEAVLIVVPGNKAKKQRRVTTPEQAAASTSPRPEGAVVVVRTPPARRIPSPASDKKHTCQTCGKSFPTHQALGGHASYHVRGAKTTSARHDDLAAAQAGQDILAHRDQPSAGNGNVTISASTGAGAGALQEHQEVQPPPSQEPAPVPKPQVQAPTPTPTPVPKPKPQAQAPTPTPTPVPKPKSTPTPTPQTGAPHVCDECNLIFPSGQALGGHKRKHWVPEKQLAKAALPAPASAPVPAPAPAPVPPPRDFDLNEMPMEGQGENNNQP